MKTSSFINSIIYFLYKYYKNDLYHARIAFCTFMLLFFYPILFYLNRVIDLGITKFMLKLNLFTSLIFITGPLFVLVLLFTIKKDEIESINEEDGKAFNIKGKKNFLILSIVIFIIWLVRMIAFAVYKN
jgi:hypothetical protein